MSFEGKYSYRFSGYAMERRISHHLIGLGSMNLDDGKITGEHYSTIMRLEGIDPACESAHYKLEGTYQSSGDFGTAIIKFKDLSSPPNDLVGDFKFVRAGTGRFWLISTDGKAENLEPPAKSNVNELVSGEAVLIG